MDIAKLIARNLAHMMDATPALSTLEKVELRSGVGYETVRRARKGEGNLTVQNLDKIARAFGCRAADMLKADNLEADKNVAREQVSPFQVKTWREQQLDAILDNLQKTNDYGLVAMVEKSKDVASDYPAQKSKTAS